MIDIRILQQDYKEDKVFVKNKFIVIKIKFNLFIYLFYINLN